MAAKQRTGPGVGGAWRRLRRLTQWISLGVFVLLVLALPSAWPAWLRQLPMQLDPLTSLAQAIASHQVVSGALVGLGVLALGLIFGRGWCGWVCPLGTLLDGLTPRRRPVKRKAPRAHRQAGDDPRWPPDSWRKIKYLLLLAVLAAALVGSTLLLVLDPLTILLRGLGSGLLPLFDALARGLETRLYQVPALRQAVTALDQALRPALLPVDPLAARAPWLMAAVLASVTLLNLVAPRFWCRYLCPLGALLGVLARFALVQRRVNEACKSCGLCARACPTGAIQEQRGYASDPAECTLCLDCQPACPRQAIGFQGYDLRQSLLRQEYDPNRREALLVLGGSLAGAWLVGQPWAAGATSQALQPPGGAQNHLVDKCIRCGACVRACPTGALQPAMLEAGLEGLWSPVLIPRLGYCDYGCNTCGSVCPVEAIPRLELADKRRQVIGVAVIDRQRCLAWSGQSPCIICEEMCPAPTKAISLESTPVKAPGGESVILQTPIVHPRRCIGCGICEYKCPVEGAAAIRVYPAGVTFHGAGAGEGSHGERRRRGQP